MNKDYDTTTDAGRKAYEQHVETMSNCIWFDYQARCVLMDVGADGDATTSVPEKPDTASLASTPVKDKDVDAIVAEISKFAAQPAVWLNALETNNKHLLLDHVIELCNKNYSAFAALFEVAEDGIVKNKIMYLMVSLGFIYYQGSNTPNREDKTAKTDDKTNMEHRFAEFVFVHVQPKERMHVIAATYAAAMALGRTGKSTLTFDTPTEYEDIIRSLTILASIAMSLHEHPDPAHANVDKFLAPTSTYIKIPVIPAANIAMFSSQSTILDKMTAESLTIALGKHFFIDDKFVSQWFVRPFKKLAQGGRKVLQAVHIIPHKNDGARRI